MTDHMTPYTKMQPKKEVQEKKTPSPSRPVKDKVLGVVFFPLLWLVCKLGGGKGAWKA